MFKIILFCLLLFNANECSSKQKISNDLMVSVYYESLCPDSKKFIVDQLFPSFLIFDKYVKWELIPFGKAKASKENGKWTFICQHGPKECYANKIHSCAIALYNLEKSTKFVYCSMNSNDPSSDEILSQCSKSSGIPWDKLSDCYESGQSDFLLAKNGNKTNTVRPPISWIPTVVFNSYYNSTLEDTALSNLKAAICDLLKRKPDFCDNHIQAILV